MFRDNARHSTICYNAAISQETLDLSSWLVGGGGTGGTGGTRLVLLDDGGGSASTREEGVRVESAVVSGKGAPP